MTLRNNAVNCMFSSWCLRSTNRGFSGFEIPLVATFCLLLVYSRDSPSVAQKSLRVPKSILGVLFLFDFFTMTQFLLMCKNNGGSNCWQFSKNQSSGTKLQ